MNYEYAENDNTVFLHILASFDALYAENGYYLEVKDLLLTGNRPTTYW